MNELFGNILKSELFKRIEKNPQYSMRAFAKSLGLDQSYLSRLMNGQRDFSPAIMRKLTQSLKLDESEVLKLVLTSEVNRRTEKLKKMVDEDLKALNKWYDFAILEIIHLNNFKFEVSEIAKSLGLSKAQVKLSLDKLVNRKHLEVKKDGVYKLLTNESDWTDTEISSTYKKELQKSILSKAIEALDETPITEREQMSLVISCDSKKINLIKRKIMELREEIREIGDQSKVKDKVYQISLSAFPLNKVSKKKENDL